jgi:DNA modification methylase
MVKLTLYHGDALEILPTLPSESIDLILTDPPYGVSNDTKIVRNGGKFGKAKDINLNFGDWDDSSVLWKALPDMVRVLKPNGVMVVFYDRLWLGVLGLILQEDYDFKVRHIGCWIKSNPTPQARKVKWQVGTEMFLVATKNQGSGHHFNYELGQSPDYFKTSVSFEHLHPTQKPLDLIEWIMKYWSFEGDTVLDPFLGSGTTMLAGLHLGRNVIGIEKEKEYIEITKKRLNWGSSLGDVEFEYIV